MSIIRKLASRRGDRVRRLADGPRNTRHDVSLESHAAAQTLTAVTAKCDSGRFGNALFEVDAALVRAPDDYELLFARASILFSWWRYSEARALLERLETHGSRSAAFYSKLGWACFWCGRLEEAVKWMRRAVALDGEDWSTHFGLGIALRARKRPAAARMAFEHALALKPDDAHTVSNLVACEVELGHIDNAAAYAQGALEREPQNASAVIDLGIVLCESANYVDAVAAFEHGDSLGVGTDDARDESVNYAICLLRAGRARQAVEMMEVKLRQHASAALHAHYALALLTCGRMQEGWDQYEFRWTQEPLLSWRPGFRKPAWTGQDLRGKTILLRAEQGYGDFIQFIRYAPIIKALGATVLLEVREELRELVGPGCGIDLIVSSNVPLPDFDYYVHLLGIPRILGTQLDSIPVNVPYVEVSSACADRWKDCISHDGMFNVGLVWAGSPTHLGDRFRSLSLRALAPLRAIKGVRFHSLQKGPPAHELVTDRGHEPIVDLAPKLETFADTAAVIERLDLLISVDTSVVHLAGALAKPVWTLVAIPGDWRWMEDREDSPWYPTMRLFRQREPGDWNDVIRDLTSALEHEAERHQRSGRCVRASAPAAVSRVPVVAAEYVAPGDLCRVAETRHGIMIYAPNDLPIGHAIPYYGEWMQRELQLLERMLEPGTTVLEAGAGIGAHSVQLASALGESGHLFLYEHDDLLKQVLQENLKANRVMNATLMRRSLLPPLAEGAHAVTDSSAPEHRDEDSRCKSLETVDDLRLKRLHWLKINQGSDAMFILDGCNETLAKLRPKLFITACSDKHLVGIAAFLSERRYGCWRSEVSMFNRENFNMRETDVFEGHTRVGLVCFPDGSAPAALEGLERLA